MICPVPEHEQERLAALRSLHILDTPSDSTLNDITALASRICQTPISLISLVDESSQWFKSSQGLSVHQTPRNISFCAHAILRPGEPLVVPDARQDPRFAANPLVIGDPYIRCYVGVPLVTSDGFALGTLCVIDRVQRLLTDDQISALTTLARQVMSQIELRSTIALQARVYMALRGFQSGPLLTDRRMQMVLETADHWLWEWDIRSGALAHSDNYRGRLGYDTAIPNCFSDWKDMLHAEDRFRVLESLNRCLCGQTTLYQAEYRLKHRNGQWIWFSARGVVTDFDAEGNPARMCGTLHDISERKLFDTRLLESEARFQTVADASPLGIFVTNTLGETIYVNKNWERLTGVPESMVVGKSWDGAIHSEDRDQVMQGWQDASKRGEQYHAVCRTISSNGTTQWVSVHAAEIREAAHCLGYVATVENITERRLLEERLRERERFLDKVSTTIPDLILIYNVATLQPIYSNRELATLLGYTAEEATRFNALEYLMHPADRARLPEHFARLSNLPEGQTLYLEYRMRHREGDWRTLRMRLAVFLRSESGEILQALALVRDITKERRIEEQLAEQVARVNEVNLQLELQGYELTVANEALKRKQSELAAANLRLETMAATDGLTGLKNHRAFQEFLNSEFRRALRYRNPLSILLLDIDHFKSYNDSFGHPAGNSMLCRLADLLQMNCRPQDLVARFGGEEFVIVLPHTGAAGAIAIANRLLVLVRNADWDHRAITVSIGVASLTHGATDPAELVKQADLALYRSKAKGRDCVIHAEDAYRVNMPGSSMTPA